MRWGKRVATIALLVVCVATGLAFAYAAYAYHAYNRIRPAQHGCIGCATPVVVNGYHLYYREVGEATGSPPVVLVHGGPGHSSLSFKNAFDFLADRTRVVYYDQRGSGNSQSKPNDADYTVDELVEELEAIRRDVLRADRIDVIGHSFGGAVAQRYALSYPQRVDKLVLIGAVPINNGMSNRFLWKWFGPALYTTALGWPPVHPDAADAWFARSANSDSADRLFDKTQSRVLEETGRLSFASWRDISLSAVGADYKTELARLNVPTLFMYGIADSPYTGEPVADETCAVIPHCTVVGFDRSGHWPFLEEPEKFQRVLREFLRS